MLAVMGPDRLARALFPLGDAPSKDAVRAEAAARGLAVSAKPDSYDICFVADGDTRGFLRARLGERPGEVVDADGRVLGEHDGAYAYTVGQRKGLGLDRPAADGKPRYVLEVRPATNTVVVGPGEPALGHRACAGGRPSGSPRTSRQRTGRRRSCRSVRTATPRPPGQAQRRGRAGGAPRPAAPRAGAGAVRRRLRRDAGARPGHDRARRPGVARRGGAGDGDGVRGADGDGVCLSHRDGARLSRRYGVRLAVTTASA